MSNLAEIIQKNLGYASLYKVDPNTQDINLEHKTFGTNSLAQAAIPVVLCGLFNFLSQPDVKSTVLLERVKWLSLVFGKKVNEIIARVATYAGVSDNRAQGEMEHIADEAVRLVNENLAAGGSDSDATLKSFFIAHKDDALVYLPASLKTGELLGNNNIDDQTHKMEGPISSLMHKMESQF